ncbi:hypothetical protein B9Q04_16255 [Candidatus Marsarchaeota G2 archaeon BE_D]|uniref:Glycosyl transferase family 1 domain-containing protein n=1 Tax=Candidatus Marsarchaeota G2 archaeon BE_D TaxID=1978158 RepID=A0A2R6C6N3_9ARCH|nr:MAG: hypothetical protein B9Q04_16255 [Candidatus Marsarchaeota G2 archaeon BE_D]
MPWRGVDLLRQKLRLLFPWYRFPPFTDKSIGGLSTTLWDNTNGLSKLGHEVNVLIPGEHEEEHLVGNILVKKSSLGRTIMQGGKLNSRAQRLLSDFDAVISVNNYGAHSLRRVLAQVHVVRQIHTVAIDRPLMTYLPLKWGVLEYAKMKWEKIREQKFEKALRGVSTVCVSGYLLKKVIEHKVEEEQNTVFIPNGVDTELFKKTSKEYKYDLLFVGRFQYAKGLDLLILALKKLWLKGLRPSLMIVGSFTPKERVHIQKIAGDELSKSISFKGVVPHELMPEVYCDARVVVVPSRYETFGLPALEGASCGVPVIATNVGGLSEILDYAPDMLVERADYLLLEKKIEEVLTGRDDLKHLIQAGRVKAESYSIVSVLEKFSNYVQNSLEANH